MAQKVIVPQKKNYVPQFLKQRDINSYSTPFEELLWINVLRRRFMKMLPSYLFRYHDGKGWLSWQFILKKNAKTTYVQTMPTYRLDRSGSPERSFRIRNLKQLFCKQCPPIGEVKVGSPDKLHKYPVPLPPNYVWKDRIAASLQMRQIYQTSDPVSLHWTNYRGLLHTNYNAPPKHTVLGTYTVLYLPLESIREKYLRFSTSGFFMTQFPPSPWESQ